VGTRKRFLGLDGLKIAQETGLIRRHALHPVLVCLKQGEKLSISVGMGQRWTVLLWRRAATRFRGYLPRDRSGKSLAPPEEKASSSPCGNPLLQQLEHNPVLGCPQPTRSALQP
jgi:hypothetical protein